MTSQARDDFIDDCFVERDPICDMHKEDSLWLDSYASKLIVEMISSPEEG